MGKEKQNWRKYEGEKAKTKIVIDDWKVKIIGSR